MSKENNLNKRPPFINYVRVRHTGLSPFKLDSNTLPVRARREPLTARNPHNAIASKTRGTNYATKATREVIRKKPTVARRHAIHPENTGNPTIVNNEENASSNIISNAEENVQIVMLENVQSEVIIEQNASEMESKENEPPVEENMPVNTDSEDGFRENIEIVILEDVQSEVIIEQNQSEELNQYVPPVEDITPVNTDSEEEFRETDFATELMPLSEASTVWKMVRQQTDSPCLDEITFSFMGLKVGENQVVSEVTPIISGLNINDEKEISSFETCETSLTETDEKENLQVLTLNEIPCSSNSKEHENSEVLIEDNTLSKLENNDKENIQPLVLVENEQEGQVESLYRSKLDSEISRLSKLADTMESHKTNSMPANILDEIDSIIGQTRLLIRSKFKQFSNLIDTFSSHKLKPEDLEGFWEMMYIQVDQLNDKFFKLEQLKDAGWITKEENQKPKKKTRRGGAKRNKKYKNIQSRLKLDKGNSVVALVPTTPVHKTPSKARKDAMEETFKNDALSKTPQLLVNKNILNAQNSRRSSFDIIVRQSLLGKLL